MSIQELTALQLADLLAPIAGEISLGPRLAEWLERATRDLIVSYREPLDPIETALWQDAEVAELERIATDPARALGAPPGDVRARHTWERLLDSARLVGLDPETRVGAVKIGDLARQRLSFDDDRVDDRFRFGEKALFEHIHQCVLEAGAAWVFEKGLFPSNAKLNIEEGKKWPAIEFARCFIEIVVDRSHLRGAVFSPRAERWLQNLLKKSDRSLLDGLRPERQSYTKHGDFGLGGDDINEVTLSRTTFFD